MARSSDSVMSSLRAMPPSVSPDCTVYSFFTTACAVSFSCICAADTTESDRKSPSTCSTVWMNSARSLSSPVQ